MHRQALLIAASNSTSTLPPTVAAKRPGHAIGKEKQERRKRNEIKGGREGRRENFFILFSGPAPSLAQGEGGSSLKSRRKMHNLFLFPKFLPP